MPLKPWTPPPVSAVPAFESAARHQSFTRAAEELHITQSAVSHAIRELEQRFHEKLFARNGKALALTDAGKTYLAFASEALQRSRAGDAALADPVRRTRVLTVSVSPSFAAECRAAGPAAGRSGRDSHLGGPAPWHCRQDRHCIHDARDVCCGTAYLTPDLPKYRLNRRRKVHGKVGGKPR